MSTSSDSVIAHTPVIQPFVYRLGGEALSADIAQDLPQPPAGPTEADVQLREAAAREQGRREADEALRQQMAAALEHERGVLSAALRDFEQQRQRYFQGVEQEVVHLALSIARKILQRECQLDPVLLSGAVRVALDRLAGGTSVRLRVPAADAAAWRAFFAAQHDLAVTPEVIHDPTLPSGGCILETEFGSTDLSAEAQMREVEQVFQDLLERRARVDS